MSNSERGLNFGFTRVSDRDYNRSSFLISSRRLCESEQIHCCWGRRDRICGLSFLHGINNIICSMCLKTIETMLQLQAEGSLANVVISNHGRSYSSKPSLIADSPLCSCNGASGSIPGPMDDCLEAKVALGAILLAKRAFGAIFIGNVATGAKLRARVPGGAVLRPRTANGAIVVSYIFYEESR